MTNDESIIKQIIQQNYFVWIDGYFIVCSLGRKTSAHGTDTRTPGSKALYVVYPPPFLPIALLSFLRAFVGVVDRLANDHGNV